MPTDIIFMRRYHFHHHRPSSILTTVKYFCVFISGDGEISIPSFAACYPIKCNIVTCKLQGYSLMSGGADKCPFYLGRPCIIKRISDQL